MRYHSGLLGVMVGIGLTLGSAAAFAVPPACNVNDTLRATYEIGLRNGRSLTERAWLRMGVGDDRCYQLERFYGYIEEALNILTPGMGELSACRIGGTYDGMFLKLMEIDQNCVVTCMHTGAFIGEETARAYCLISIAVNGLEPAEKFMQGPTGICGVNERVTCRTKFFETAQGYPGCGPYTQGPYRATYEAEESNSCQVPPLISMAPASTDDADVRLAELWSRMNAELYTVEVSMCL